MLDKVSELEAAVAFIKDGDRVMLGGFGVPGTPFQLIDALVHHGAKDLTIIKNDANEDGMGVDWLLENGQVRKLISSHIGLNSRAVEMMNKGDLDVEFVAQGILAERIRSGGAGLMGFITDIGIDTDLASGKMRIEIDGVSGIIESALRADVALIHADTADSFGNLGYTASARNFNPLMAMAANKTIVEAENLVPPGAIAPDDIHTPGPFVDHVIELREMLEVYGVVKRHG
ncbi:MAG: CoA transferase subunit A [Rhodospirillales bacterium]|nr:CoA transferase subunit A [Rhodospirillales bacterium]